MSTNPIPGSMPVKRIYTLADLAELTKSSSKVPHKKMLPDNVVTLSSMRLEKEQKEDEEMKTKLRKQMEETSRITEAISEVSKTMRDVSKFLDEDEAQWNELDEKVSEALAKNERVIKDSQQFLSEFHESLHREIEQLKSLREPASVQTVSEQEVKNFEIQSTTASLREEPGFNKTWYTRAYDGIKSADEWSIKKVSNFFSQIWQWIEVCLLSIFQIKRK